MIYGDPAYRSRSWRAWCVGHPDLHVRLRNLIFSISAWVYRRFSHFHRSQGRAYLLGDPKNGADFRQSVLEEMSGLDWCCRGRFWTTLLAKSKSDRINKPLTDPWWHWVLFHVMILISWLPSIADTERDHKLSKDILRESSPMKRPTFSAMHTNTRVARLHEPRSSTCAACSPSRPSMQKSRIAQELTDLKTQRYPKHRVSEHKLLDRQTLLNKAFGDQSVRTRIFC